MTPTLRDHIDRTPMTPYQWAIVGLCVVLNAVDGYDVAAMSFTSARVQDEFALSGSALGWLISATLIGMAVGSTALGPVADRIGRRPTVLASVAAATLGMLLASSAGSVEVLALCRVLTGLGVGGILTCVTVIITEYANDRRRGLAMGAYAAGYGVGATLGGLAAVSLQSGYGWRSVYLLGGSVSLVLLVAIALVVPESAQFLLTRRPRGHTDRLAAIARRLGATDVSLVGGSPVSTTGEEPSPGPRALFTGGRGRRTVLVWMAFFTTMFGFYFVNTWTPRLLVDAGMTADQGVVVGMGLAIGGAAGSVGYGLLVARTEPVRLLVVALVASAVAVAVLVLATAALAAAVAVGVVVGALVNACVAGLYTVTPSLYAAGVRGTGVGAALGVGRAGAILAPVAAGALLDLGWTPARLYLTVTAVLVVGAVAAHGLPPHPRGQGALGATSRLTAHTPAHDAGRSTEPTRGRICSHREAPVRGHVAD